MDRNKITVTNESQDDQESVSKTTRIRLIDALLDVWANAPPDDASVRVLALKAGAAQSAIHYHFGDMEHLYLSASNAALDAARDWMDRRLAQCGLLADDALTAELQASLIATMIADWTGGQRRLAMAWRNAPGAEWQAAWESFWSRFAALLGLGKQAMALSCFAAGEASRHLLVWNAPLDRALLEETVAALVMWLRERRLSPDFVRPAYRTLARRGYDAPASPGGALEQRIAAAAGALLAETGHVGVTFRAVAAEARVTLGKVIHVYGTKSGLLHAALHSLYEREALGGDLEHLLAQSFTPEVMRDQLLDAVLGGQQPVLQAYDEIERAIYNGPDYVALRGLVRSMEDPSGTWALQQMMGGTSPPAALVAAFSAIIRGIGYRALHAGVPEDDQRAGARAALRPFLP